jgi:hypothetical protein
MQVELALTNLLVVSINLQKDEIEKDCKKRQQKADTLEQLCRTLQTERTSLIQRLKAFEEEANSVKLEPDTNHSQDIVVENDQDENKTMSPNEPILATS